MPPPVTSSPVEIRHACDRTRQGQCDRWTKTTNWPGGSRRAAPGCGRWRTGCSARSAMPTMRSRRAGWARGRARLDDVANLEGWFTTIVARVCLDMLRSRKSRREEPLNPDDAIVAGCGQGPEQEAMLADSVGLAMLVVLDKLAPAERVAFVLHDTFGLPFGEIAAITGRTPASARQLAAGPAPGPGFGAASPAAGPAAGGGPGVHGRGARRRPGRADRCARPRRGAAGSDAAASPSGRPVTVRGAAAVAGGARAAAARARYGRVALINGTPGVVMAPRGRLVVALAFTYSGDKISQIDVIADPAGGGARPGAARPGWARLSWARPGSARRGLSQGGIGTPFGTDKKSDRVSARPVLPPARRRAGGGVRGGVPYAARRGVRPTRRTGRPATTSTRAGSPSSAASQASCSPRPGTAATWSDTRPGCRCGRPPRGGGS